ncbi:hypothetical protein [Rhodanobacter fulvus]|uniref:hypothetical protein n=1 Tax=Rhodanobacter fulvus TaxID=219571 RepID=UPI0012EA9F0D|nr:hypothetical protein [Rhodanobacter fulvus]
MPFTALDELNRYRVCRNAMNCIGTIVVRTATVRNADLRIVAAAPHGDREWTTARDGGFRTHCRSGIRRAWIKGRSRSCVVMPALTSINATAVFRLFSLPTKAHAHKMYYTYILCA